MRPKPQSALAFPLNAVLGSQASVRVLRVLARHGGALSASTVARQAELSAAVARSALADLTVAGVATSVGQGRAVSYRIDPTHPLIPALEQVFRAESERRDAVFEGLRHAAETLQPDPVGVWVYGSVARGEDTVTSDVDVALCVADAAVLVAQTELLREAAAAIGERQRVAISVISFTAADAARLAREDAPIWRGIVQDGVALVGRRPEAVAALRAPTPSRRS